MPDDFGLLAELPSLRQALIALPLAALLGTALAFRPRRRGTPPRNPAVIETQILLWCVESIEADPFNVFTLKIDTKIAQRLRPRLEKLLTRNQAIFELRGSSDEALTYEVQLPLGKHLAVFPPP